MKNFNQDKTPKQTLLFSSASPITPVTANLYLPPADKVQPVDNSVASKPHVANRHILPASTHDEICKRIHQKHTRILTFLADGEIWSCTCNLSHILRLSVRQTQFTLARMVKEKLLKLDTVCGIRIYGISEHGRAYLNAEQLCRIFSVGKTSPRTIEHHRISQKIRIELERYYDAGNFIPGKRLYGKKIFINIPDCIFHRRGLIFAGEIELTIKSGQHMKLVLTNYCKKLAAFDDPAGGLHKVVYFTPHPNAVRKLIDKFVPGDLRGCFYVCQIDRQNSPYSNLLFIPDQDLDRFLSRAYA